MPVRSDLHMHTSFSEDSRAPMESMVQKAISLGLDRICFTEHIDYDLPAQFGTFLVDLPAYREEYLRIRDQYSPQIEVLFGIELGMQPHLPDRYRQLVSDWPFDFVIASQHLVAGSDPYFPDIWTQKSEEEVIGGYLRELYENLQTMPSYDTCAHLDFVVRYAPNKNRYYSWQRYAEYIDPILKHLISADKCLELNTAGLRKGLGEPNPASDILQRYHDLGGRLITIGSDAHTPADIGFGFDQAAAILQRIGFTHYQYFRNRRRIAVPI